MSKESTGQKINQIVGQLGLKDFVVVKDFYIGRNCNLNASIIYIKSLVDKKQINENILKVLMLESDESLACEKGILEYICKKYITIGEAYVETEISRVIESVANGKSVIILEKVEGYIIIDTANIEKRPISDPENESSIRGTREGFVESMESNIGIIKEYIKDKSFTIEKYKVGRRSQMDLAVAYIKELTDEKLINEIRKRIKNIDIDFINGSGMIEQLIEDSTYSFFPQTYATERPDIVTAHLMDGQIALILNQTPFIITVPAVFQQFFQTVEDYYERTMIASFTRIIRVLATIIVISLPSLYLSLISYNVELIPIKFIIPIAQSRQGIPLPPFFEILLMEIIIEFLREGGLRLPPKIAQTLSIVGGIIIGNAAIESKVVSPSTLLVIGISTVASFLIPNYAMSRSIRLVRFLMLVLAEALGFLGIAVGWLFLLVHLFSLESLGFPYFVIKRSDLKDFIIRAPWRSMKKRPEIIPNKDPVRQKESENRTEDEKNE